MNSTTHPSAQQIDPKAATEAERILELFYQLPDDMKAHMNIVIEALATMEHRQDPKRETLIRFMEWATTQDPSFGRYSLETMALACKGNETAWGIIRATLEDEE